MHKLLKGSIAAAAGITLLAGGAGTFALWNQNAAISAQQLTSGFFTLTPGTDGVWKNGSTPITASSYKIVPGTTLTYTQTLTVVATGDDLVADLTWSGLTGTNTLSSYVVSTLAATSPSATDVSAAHDGSRLRFSPGTSVVTAKVTVNFDDHGDTTGSASMSKVLDLSQGTFTLAQVAPTQAP